jgi:hypothetical protein
LLGYTSETLRAGEGRGAAADGVVLSAYKLPGKIDSLSPTMVARMATNTNLTVFQ